MKPEIREVFYSEEYLEYYDSLDEKTKEKYDYVVQIIKTQYVVNKKFVKKKKLNSMEQEYRQVTMSIEHCSLLSTTRTSLRQNVFCY